MAPCRFPSSMPRSIAGSSRKRASDPCCVTSLEPQDDSAANVNAAKVALARWAGDTLSGQHFGASPSTVFKTTIAGRYHALRLTPASFRTRRLIEAECDFVDFLASNDIPVARPIRSISGNWVEE